MYITIIKHVTRIQIKSIRLKDLCIIFGLSRLMHRHRTMLPQIGTACRVSHEYDMKIQDEIRRYSAKLSIRKSKLDEEESVVVNARDITEKFKIEHALKESEEKYFQIFNTVLDGLAILNMDGIIIDVNPVIIKMYGYGNREEFIGKHASDFISPNYYYAFEQFVKTITESGEIPFT